MECVDFEEPVCAITECYDCRECAPAITELYKCVIDDMISGNMKQMLEMGQSSLDCPMDCSGDGFVLDVTETNSTGTRYLLN
jgi:hypothetical protein